jgi:hypothetical protein
VDLSAGEVRLPQEYWRGAGAQADLVITAHNSGEATERIEVVYSTPDGVVDTKATWTGGCVELAARTYRCTADAVAVGASWSFRARLRVDAESWRRAPLFGSATATAGIVDVGTIQAQREYAVTFPPGPARPNLALWAGDIVLPSATIRAASLAVRVGNYGDVPASGRVELTAPAGVTLTSVSSRCQSFVRLSPQRVRCELGRLAVNQSVPLAFGLSFAPGAAQSKPLEGSAYAILSPPGGRAAEARTTFRLLTTAVIPPVTARATRPPALISPIPVDLVQGGGGGGVDSGDGGERGMTATVIIAVIVGLFAALCVLVLISLRGRLAEDRSAI